ncbi:MAG: hypothetical protein JNK64_09425 [Myxococcales bacterium]|nr:hypothetical protein [Myxococcales bacterium]
MSPPSIAEVRAAWPDAHGDPAVLAAAAAGLDPSADHAQVMLAWACALGAASALDQLERDALGPAARHLAARGFDPARIDEAIQETRVRLIVGGADRAPGLLAYRGRGPLAAFVRTTAVRIALDLGSADRDDPEPTLALLADGAPDPDLQYLRTHYAAALGQALATAWAGLPRHERFVLGLALHHRLDSEAIARVYGCHRATAARKLATARATLYSATRDALRAALAVDDPTVDSILRVVTTSLRWQALAPLVAEPEA